MGIFSFVSNIIKPVGKIIDDLHTSDEEKMQLRKQIMAVENEFQAKILSYESKLMEAQSSIVQAEANGQSWIQRNWRPITMLTFLVLVVLNSFGLLVTPLLPEAWTLLQIGLGGYVAGRSIEKVVPALVASRKKNDEAAG